MYRIRDFDKSSRNMFVIKKLFAIIVYIITIPIIIYNFTLLIKSYINHKEIPSFLGFKSFVIVSESMEPTIMTGDAIFVKEVSNEEIKEKDIISFQDQATINTHRIIKIENDNRVTKYITKGDNNKNVDKKKVIYEEIEGVYAFRIKGFGKLLEILKNKITLIILLIILILISVNQVRMTKRKLKRKEKRYKYNLSQQIN